MLTAADLPFVDGAAGRAGQPLARSEVVYSGQPVALVVAETEAAAADGVDEVVVDIEPLEAALDLEARDGAGRGAGARVDVVEGDGADVGGAHAAAGGGDAGADEEELSDNVAGRQRMTAGDAAAALAGGAARAAGRFSTSWIHQGYMEPQVGHRVARARGRARGELEHAGRLQHAPAAGRPARLAARPRARAPGAAGRRVRRQAHDRRAAGGRRDACALERPVRLALTRIEDFAASNPAPGEVIDARGGRHAPTATLTGVRGRIVLDRGSNDEFGFEALAAMLASGPYRWQARDVAVLRRADQPRRLRRLPRAGGAARRLRDRDAVDELAAKLGLDPIELRLRNVLREGDQGLDGKPVPGLRGRRVPGAPARAPAVGAPRRAARRRGRRRGDRLVARRPRARGRELPPGRRRQADDRHRRGRHERDGDRVPVDRRRGLRARRTSRSASSPATPPARRTPA